MAIKSKACDMCKVVVKKLSGSWWEATVLKLFET